MKYDLISQSLLILCVTKTKPNSSKPIYVYKYRYYFYREEGGKEISKDQSSSWENKERSNHFCLTKNNNESRETKFKHVWVFFGKVIWIHLWIKPKARKRQEEEKMLSRCVFPFFPTKVNFSEIRVTESGHEFKQFPPNKTGLRLADLSGLPIMCPLFWRENHLNSWPDSYLRKNWH